MAGDLEEFLRRAAQRRAQKAQAAGAPPQRQPPQYTDSRTERVARPVEDDVVIAEVVTAEVVSDPYEPGAEHQREATRAKKQAARARAQHARKLEAAEQKSRDKKAAAKSAAKQKASDDAKARSDARRLADSENLVQDLLSLIRKPGGIQQAVLLREIMDRPDHRW